MKVQVTLEGDTTLPRWVRWPLNVVLFVGFGALLVTDPNNTMVRRVSGTRNGTGKETLSTGDTLVYTHRPTSVERGPPGKEP